MPVHSVPDSVKEKELEAIKQGPATYHVSHSEVEPNIKGHVAMKVPSMDVIDEIDE